MNLSTSKSYTKINKRFDWLDGVRGCAILFVVIFHSVEVLPKDSLLRYFFSFGQYGVQLFFVVSALTCVLTLKKNKIIDWYIRRFIRIALIYYIGIIIYYPIFKLEAIIGVKSDEFSNLKNIVANIFFIHGWVPSANNNVVPGGWSIAVEMNFYLIAPFIVLLGSKTKYGVIILNIFLILSLLLFNYIYNFPVVNNSFEYFWPINQLPVFFIVIAL
ncbi:acyltransferase family protein, partial [Acinetobacter soli]